MKFDEFVKKYLGKKTDYDGTSGVQCVDLAKLYIDKVVGVKPQSIGDAYAYYDDFYDTYLNKYFTRIKYKRGLKPQKGDLVVWGRKFSKYGHIAIATGKANLVYLYTYDQNWGKKEMQLVRHTYKGISGYLRPKNQSNIVTPPKIAYGNYKLTKKRGVYKGYGSKSGLKSVKELTSDGKKHATSSKPDAPAYLKKGTPITIKETKLLTSGNLWAKIPSGYICIWNGTKNKMYIKMKK